jgi:hypothetical protein
MHPSITVVVHGEEEFCGEISAWNRTCAIRASKKRVTSLRIIGSGAEIISEPGHQMHGTDQFYSHDSKHRKCRSISDQSPAAKPKLNHGIARALAISADCREYKSSDHQASCDCFGEQLPSPKALREPTRPKSG